jgi:hypothetical protein
MYTSCTSFPLAIPILLLTLTCFCAIAAQIDAPALARLHMLKQKTLEHHRCLT